MLWLFRAKPNGVTKMREFLKRNIVALGVWDDTESFLGCARQDIESNLTLAGRKGKKLERDVFTVDSFVNQMKIGELAVVHSGKSVWIAKINGEYAYRDVDAVLKDGSKGFPHQRKVKFLKRISREELSEGVRGLMSQPRGVCSTIEDISEFEPEICALLEGE